MNKGYDMTDSTNIDLLFGCIRISSEGEYHPGKFTIETFGYWNRDEPTWGMPAWDERGFPEFMEHFDSYNSAYKAIKGSWWDMDRVI